LQGTQQYKAPEVYHFNNNGNNNGGNNGNNNAQHGQRNPNPNPNGPNLHGPDALGYASAPVDVWSAGVLLYAALNRQYPFTTGHIHNVLDVDT
jgi:serine/threonine protein kinase